jgi:glycosyltransferase involved in cell wall biosynthesis
VGGVRELVREEVDGLFVPSETPQAFADAIKRLLAAPSLAENLGASGGKRVRELFTSEVSAKIIARHLPSAGNHEIKNKHEMAAATG